MFREFLENEIKNRQINKWETDIGHITVYERPSVSKQTSHVYWSTLGVFQTSRVGREAGAECSYFSRQAAGDAHGPINIPLLSFASPPAPSPLSLWLIHCLYNPPQPLPDAAVQAARRKLIWPQWFPHCPSEEGKRFLQRTNLPLLNSVAKMDAETAGKRFPNSTR